MPRKQPKPFAQKTSQIPKEIYDKALKDIADNRKLWREMPMMRENWCHREKYQYLNEVSVVPYSFANLMEAAKQALENRNFRALYAIIIKGLKQRNFSLDQQMMEVRL